MVDNIPIKLIGKVTEVSSIPDTDIVRVKISLKHTPNDEQVLYIYLSGRCIESYPVNKLVRVDITPR